MKMPLNGKKDVVLTSMALQWNYAVVVVNAIKCAMRQWSPAPRNYSPD